MVAINAYRTASKLAQSYTRTGALLITMDRIVWMHDLKDRCGKNAWIEVLGAVLALRPPAGPETRPLDDASKLGLKTPLLAKRTVRRDGRPGGDGAGALDGGETPLDGKAQPSRRKPRAQLPPPRE